MPSIGSHLVGISNACRLHMGRRTEKRAKNLQRQLRVAVEQLDRLRHDATRLAADLRNLSLPIIRPVAHQAARHTYS
jgi:hypothetical protein